MTITNSRPPRRSLNLEEVCSILGCRPSKLYADIKAGIVPSPFRIASRAVRWDSDEIYDAFESIKAAGKEAWLADFHVHRAPVNLRLRKPHHRNYGAHDDQPQTGETK